MTKGVERAHRAQQFSGGDRQAMMEKARARKQMQAQQASPRADKAHAAKDSMKARAADPDKKAMAAQKRDHANDLRRSRKDEVSISKEGKEAHAAAKNRKASAARPQAQGQRPQQMKARGFNAPGNMGNMPTSAPPKGMDKGVTPQFSERTSVSFGGKG